MMAALTGQQAEAYTDHFIAVHISAAFGATPSGTRTAAVQAAGEEPGNTFGQGESVPLIAMAHRIPYMATW